MKILTSYTLNINDNTIDLSNEANFDIKRLQKITNVSKDNKVIYDINKKDLGYSTVIDGIVTLKYDISAFSLGDKLRIEYSEGDSYATSSDINLVVSAIKTNKNFDQTIWCDSINGYYLLQSVVDTETGDITNTWIKPDGTPVTPAVDAKVFQYVNNQATINREYRALVTNNTKGFISGDRIAQTEIYNITNSPATLQETIWKNLTSNSVITPAPSIGTEVDILDALENQETTQQQVKAVLDNLKTNSDTLNLKDFATAAKQDAAKAVFDDINANLGAKTDSVASTDTGTFSLISLVKKGLVSLSSLVGVDFSTAAKQDAAKNVLDGIKTNSDKLTNNPALETGGNLDTIATKTNATSASVANLDTNLGAKADSVASTDTGTFSLISLVKLALTKFTSIVTNTSSLVTFETKQSLTNQVLNTTGSVVFSGLTDKKSFFSCKLIPNGTSINVYFEASFDGGSTWDYIPVTAVKFANISNLDGITYNGIAVGLSNTTGSVLIVGNAFGADRVRARVSSLTGTSITINFFALDSNPYVTLGGFGGIGSQANFPVTIGTINGQPAMSQKTMANSFPVVISSDQSAVASNITQVGGTNIGVGTTVNTRNIPAVGLASTINRNSGTNNSVTNNASVWTASNDCGISVKDEQTISSWVGTGSMRLILAESIDGGTNYTDIWQSESITGNGTYKIPEQMIFGSSIKVYQVITGTVTSFTRTYRNAVSSAPFPIRRQFFDTTANILNGTLSATTTAYNISGCSSVLATVTIGAATIPAYYQLQLSSDNNNWVDIGLPVQSKANKTVKLEAENNNQFNFARVICTGAATSQTGTNVCIMGNSNGNPSEQPRIKTDLQKSVFGETIMTKKRPEIQLTYVHGYSNKYLNAPVTTGSGSRGAVANAMISLSTSTTVGTIEQTSVNFVTYVAGIGVEVLFSFLFSFGTGNTEQTIGHLDINKKNGFLLSYRNGVLNIIHRSNNVETVYAQSSWSTDKADGAGLSGFNIDVTKLNLMKLEFQYLGAGDIVFYLKEEGSLNFIEVHRIKWTNKNTTPSTLCPFYRMYMYVSNANNTTAAVTMKSASFSASKQGEYEAYNPATPVNNSKTGITTETSIIGVKSVATINSLDNNIPVKLIGLDVSSSNGTGTCTVRLLKNPTVTSQSFADIDTGNSVLQKDTAGTTITSGTEVGSMTLAANGSSKYIDMEKLNIILAPGETLVATGAAGNTTNFNVSMFLREQW